MLRKLLALGVLPSDASLLDTHFAGQDDDDFVEGLEETSRCLLTKEQPRQINQAEPWRTLLLGIQNSGESGYLAALGSLPAIAQSAVIGATTARLNDIRNYLQQQQPGGKQKRKTREYIKLLETMGYRFRLNQVTQDLECNGEPMHDNLRAEIRAKARDAGVYEVYVMEDAYAAHGWKQRYHPIKDYLTALKWEGQDVIDELGNHFVDDQGIFKTLLKRWLVGAVARVMQGGTQNRMLILDGKQNLGKSSFVRWLASPLPEYHFEGPIQPEDKDSRLRRMTIWIWEVGEFGSTTRRTDREALKAFLSTQIIRDRKPFARYDTQGPAIASFIGTVNNEMGILSDPTGSRRFMAATIRAIDWGYTKLNVDQVWAQAFELYLSNEPWNLLPAEVAQVEKINEEYQVVDLVEESILRWFEIKPDELAWKLTTLQILDVLKDPTRGNLKAGEVDMRKVAAALTNLGLAQPMRLNLAAGRRLRGYVGIRVR